MIGSAVSSPPLTPVSVSHRNSAFLGGASSAVPFPPRAPPPTLTLRLPPRRISAACGAAAPEKEAEYTTAGAGSGSAGGYSSSYSSSMSAFAAPAASQSLYDVLGLSPRATGQEVKAAYRRLARSCHPDAAKGGGGAEQFMRVHAAYATLSDPDKRAHYDRGLAVSVPSAASTVGGRVYQRMASYPAPGSRSTASSPSYSSPPGFQSMFGRRTWETDQCW